MGLVKIHYLIAGEDSNSRHLFYFPNVDDAEGEDKKVSGTDSGNDSDDCKIAEVGCEVGLLEGQTCSIPYELYDLPDLKEILSLETWNSCLTDEERFNLSSYLPDMNQQTFCLTMKELLAGNEMFFSSPLAEIFERLKGGFYPSKVTHLREGLQLLQKRTYYHFLRSYHENMGKTFLDMKTVWNQFRPSISVEERVHIWRRMKNGMGTDPLNLNGYSLDGDPLRKEVNTKTVITPSTKKIKYIDSKGSNIHHLSHFANGMKLVAPNTSAKGVLKMKPLGMKSFHTHLTKSVPADNWRQCRPAPKGVLKIVPKGLSGRQEQLREMPVQVETQLIEAPVLQMSRFSPLMASLYQWDAREHDEESSFLHQTVGGRKACRSPELPDCMTERLSVEFFNNTNGSSKNLEHSIRKPKQVKDQPYDAIKDLQEHKHNSILGDPAPWNRDDGHPKGGHRLSRNSLDTMRYSCEGESCRQNFGQDSIESSQNSWEPYTFSAEYCQGEQLMAPLQQELISMHPRISEVVSTPLDVSIRDCEMLKSSLDRSKRFRDVGLGGSHKPYDPSTIPDGFQGGSVFPITYKRRKAQTKLNASDFVKPMTAGADSKSTTLREANKHIGESAKAVKIKFKNWKEKSLDKQGISNGLQHGSPSACTENKERER